MLLRGSGAVLPKAHSQRRIPARSTAIQSGPCLHIGSTQRPGLHTQASSLCPRIAEHGNETQVSALGNRPILAAAVAQESSVLVVDQSFVLPKGNAQVQVTVEQSDSGAQVIRVSTPLQAGRLLLHWGVEGGKDYKGGWRLPGSACRPEGTTQYKDRALQSPFIQRGNTSELVIKLTPDEASDLMNFVLKDDATNTWYDNNSSNFRVPLRADADVGPKKIETLPKPLCDKWAWVRWDNEGRPSRSEGQATEDYDKGVQEMKELLDNGRTIDELWRVAEAKWKYADYKEKVIRPTIGDAYAAHTPRSSASPPAQKQKPVKVGPVPEDLLAVMAYVLWEKGGKPQGADFTNDARREIEQRTSQGMTYEQIAQQLNYTPKWTTSSVSSMSSVDGGDNGKGSRATAEAPPATKAPAQHAQVGKPLGAPSRNPLDMIKPQSNAPVLSADKGQRRESPLEFLVQRFALDPSTQWRRAFALGGGNELLAVVRQDNAQAPVRVDFISDSPSPLVLHWGVSKPGSKEWLSPPEEIWPDKSSTSGDAVETSFVDCDDDECDVMIMGAKVPLQRTSITIPADSWVGGLVLVMRSSDSTMWYKDGNGNFHIPVPCKHAPKVQDPTQSLPDDLSKAIVEAENTNAWTLMHRFNKAADLLNEVLNGYYDMDVTEAFSRIYVWLRYSATRKLTWQRNYNTQPRILSAAQERLTNTIANAHSRTSGEAQEWVRVMLTCVGRGGDGQRIRDEILNIMHRNHIPEKKGLWMEAWHQKLHNNTTPDDVPICEAYLAYLEGNGNMNAYWRVLSDAGITRQRLESYDRPIPMEPDWFEGKKDALIRDFRNYLGILKAVHSGADLQSSSAAAGNKIPNGARGYLGYVLSHLGDSQILPLMEAAVEARTELSKSLSGNRELLYLDLSLEDQVRQAAERGIGSAGFGAAAYMRPLLQNLALSLGDNEEVCYCLKAWNELPGSVRNGGRPSKDDALLAVAVINRIRRAISTISDNTVNRIGDIGRMYGEAFGVEAWARDLFAEEVVRGGPAFAVSLLITSIEAHLRNAAALGAWQVISPQQVTGVVEVVEGLSEVQEKVYKTPTVLLAHQVTGEEEIPEGVVAVLTPDAPDVLSHVSVRARNMRVLFATCHDAEPLDQIKAAKGKILHFTTTASGAVNWTEVQSLDGHAGGQSTDKPSKGLVIEVPQWSGKWVVGMDDYRNGVVGAKSKNLAGLRGKLPDDIKLPASVTLPFGCFEQVLNAKENTDVRNSISELVGQLVSRDKNKSANPLSSIFGGNGGSNGNSNGSSNGSDSVDAAEVLSKCRELALKVKIPDVVKKDLTAAMKSAGIPVPESEERWAMAMDALKGVWASKYNDRAYYSLRKVGLNFDDVRMAVLVQRVVPAQYAFVIHTRNPSNNDEAEIFCELVRGLGESLVSGMIAGSAIAFKANKSALDNPEVLCYASKSEGMFVRESLIFRSDSNGEDLEGYAGAGLYESITMDPTETTKVDYMDDKLVQDPKFRKELLSAICKVGYSIEKALGSAQDIEGVVGPDGVITVVQTRPQV